MHVISKDSPCYFLTSVAKDRLPVFRKDEMKDITCKRSMRPASQESLLSTPM